MFLLATACIVILNGAAPSESPTGRPVQPPSNSDERSHAVRSDHSVRPPSMSDEKPVDFPGVHNVVAYGDGLYSGSAPEGAVAFETLAAMGIRTIISVDGAEPDVARARAAGLRYVHLPIGYNGMDRTRTLEIARAIKDLPGPTYIHCHHGKHRSAGAAGAAAVTLGTLSTGDALRRMKVSGTSPSYAGLYGCVAVAETADDEMLQSVSGEFPEAFKTTGLVKTMVEIDHVYELLKAVDKADWKVPPDHPDLVPAAEAGRLADLHRILLDDERVRLKPAQFMAWMKQGSELAEALERRIVGGAASADELRAQFKLIDASCRDCHTTYRD